MTKKLSQEFSRTESRILGAMSKLDVFVLNPQARVQSGHVPETLRNSNRENRETNGDRSQNDPHPEMGVSLSQPLKNVVQMRRPTVSLRFGFRRNHFALTGDIESMFMQVKTLAADKNVVPFLWLTDKKKHKRCQ